MRANEYIKQYGLDKARELYNSDDWSTVSEYFLISLKRLIESHELVETYNGINGAKNTLNLFVASIEIGLYHGVDGVNSELEIPRIKQAIADVESCQ